MQKLHKALHNRHTLKTKFPKIIPSAQPIGRMEQKMGINNLN